MFTHISVSFERKMLTLCRRTRVFTRIVCTLKQFKNSPVVGILRINLCGLRAIIARRYVQLLVMLCVLSTIVPSCVIVPSYSMNVEPAVVHDIGA